MPCSSLVEAGDGATLLIHEATMGDDQEAMAHHKAHSTVSQAVGIGRQCVFSTHLSFFLFAHRSNGGADAG